MEVEDLTPIFAPRVKVAGAQAFPAPNSFSWVRTLGSQLLLPPLVRTLVGFVEQPGLSEGSAGAAHLQSLREVAGTTAVLQCQSQSADFFQSQSFMSSSAEATSKPRSPESVPAEAPLRQHLHPSHCHATHHNCL